jgi:hypothetical protein
MFGNNYPNYLGNYSYPTYQGNNYQPQQAQPIMPKTNKVFVTSLDDALSRAVEPNSESIYLHQDKNIIFDVKTDMQGRKTWKAYEFKEYIEQEKAPADTKESQGKDFVSKEEFEAFKGEIQASFKELKEKVVIE